MIENHSLIALLLKRLNKMNRLKRILLSFLVWLIPICGIYFGTQVIYPNHHIIGIIVGVVSVIILLPFSGILLDSLTNDRVIYLNVYKPWKSHLDNK